MKKFAVIGLLLALTLVCHPALAAEARPTQVRLRGLVCSFCAGGLNEVLRKQKVVDRFEIRLAQGDVLIWPKGGLTPLADRQIEKWVELSGLRVREILH